MELQTQHGIFDVRDSEDLFDRLSRHLAQPSGRACLRAEGGAELRSFSISTGYELFRGTAGDLATHRAHPIGERSHRERPTPSLPDELVKQGYQPMAPEEAFSLDEVDAMFERSFESKLDRNFLPWVPLEN